MKGNPYYYLFYKVNKYIQKVSGYKETEVQGVLGTSVILLFFKLQIYFHILIYLYPEVEFTNEYVEENKLVYGIILLLDYFINEFLLTRKNKHKKIMEYYKDESELQSLLGSIGIVFFGLFFFSMLWWGFY